jgi:hypothetical protein
VREEITACLERAAAAESEVIGQAVARLGRDQRIKLTAVFLDRIALEPLESVLERLSAADRTKVFEASANGMTEQDARNAVDALEDAPHRRLQEAVTRNEPERLLGLARNALAADTDVGIKDLGVETDDILRRLRGLQVSPLPE